MQILTPATFRPVLLLLLHLCAWPVFGYFQSPNLLPLDSPGAVIQFSVLVSLGFPAVPVAMLVPMPAALKLALIRINPFIWVAIVELLLRRFVDRPKDSDAG